MVTRSWFIEGLLAEEEKHRKTKLGIGTVILFLATVIRGKVFISCFFACWEIVPILVNQFLMHTGIVREGVEGGVSGVSASFFVLPEFRFLCCCQK